MGEIDEIKGFFGKYRFLSNFHLKPVEFEGLLYPSNENAYQAAKSLDESVRRRFLPLEPKLARNLGRKIDIRPDWEDVKYQIMLDLNRTKYAGGFERILLLNTKDAYLEESNYWHDIFWGVCHGSVNLGSTVRHCRLAPHDPWGENKLGEILMKVRSEL